MEAKHETGSSFVRWSRNDVGKWEAEQSDAVAHCQTPEIADALARMWNACGAANPGNPVAAAEALPDLLAFAERYALLHEGCCGCGTARPTPCVPCQCRAALAQARRE